MTPLLHKSAKIAYNFGHVAACPQTMLTAEANICLWSR
jgi:hypothetical protein